MCNFCWWHVRLSASCWWRVMGVAKLGKTNPIFVDPEVKMPWCAADLVATACHVWDLWRVICLPARQWVLLDTELVRQLAFWYGRHPLSFHQTGAPPPPDTPELSPADYRIWREMRQRLYQTEVHNFDEQKLRMLWLTRGLEQSVISDAITECANVSECILCRATGKHLYI